MYTKGRIGKVAKRIVMVLYIIILVLAALLLLSYIYAHSGNLDPSSAIDFWSVKTWLMLEGNNYSDAATCAVCIASHF